LNRKKTGERYYEDQTIAPICDDGQHITHFVAAGRDITERKRTEEALRRLNAQLEREAERIAHMLHDEAGQFLTSVHISLADVARDLPAPARTRMSEVRTHLEEIEAQLRRLSHEMRPRILDDLGLAAALEFLASGVMQRTGIVVITEVIMDERLPPVVETTLYRFVQEGLTNAGKHARPQRINVAISRDAQTVRCAVRDDGVGFDAAEVFARRGESSLGLVGIRDRVEALGGTLTIASHPGQGTELNALIPLGNNGT
jgi:signal transduction histidine kinase